MRMERAPTRRDSLQPDASLADVPQPGTDELATAPAVIAEAPPGVLAKLGRVVPGADTLVRFAYWTAGISAVSAALIVAALIDIAAGPDAIVGDPSWPLALAVFVILCIPAGAAALVGWTLSDLVRLPGQLRQAAIAAAGGASGAVKAKGSRIARIFRAIWAARGLALGSKDAGLRAVAAARFIRLASLPFVLALVGMFALNGLVIAAGLASLLVLVL